MTANLPIGPDLLSDDADLLGTVLRDVIYDVPYTSVSPFYEYYGDAPAPARFGMACAWQSFEVGRRLAELGGPPVSYLVDGRHVAAVVRTAESLTVLDPYLLHDEPLRVELSSTSHRSASVTAAAFPVRRDEHNHPAPARLRATWSPGRRELRLEYVRFSPVRQHNVLSRVFTLPLDATVATARPARAVVRGLLLHPEQNNLSIRVVDRERQDVRELIYPLTGPGCTTPVSRQHLLARDNSGSLSASGERSFRATVGGIARTLWCSAADVCDFVLGGVALYRRAAPPTLEPQPYAIGDE